MDNGASSYHRFLEGDNSGFEDIVKLYGDHLMFFINRYVKNLTIAEDLMEDTFLELIIHKRKFREDAKFKTYLFQIGRNKALNHLKRASHMKQVPIEDYENDIAEKELIETMILQKEQYAGLYAAIRDLKPEYSEILHLLYFEEMSYEEAAVIMKKSMKQIDNLAYRAKQKLKSTLEKEDFIYEN